VIDAIVADEPAAGPDELVTGTMMDSQEARARLAREVLELRGVGAPAPGRLGPTRPERP
jgi:hypothetical protein